MKIFTLFLVLSVFVTVCYSQIQIKGNVQVIENGEKCPASNVSVVLYKTSDSAEYYALTTSDNNGDFIINNVDRGVYTISLSLLGYKTRSIEINIVDISDNLLALDDIVLEDNIELLSEVLVIAKQSSQNIDNKSFTFSREQIDASKEARDLILNIPHLIIDKTSNSLASSDGGSLLILINGVKSNNSELKLIPAHKVKRVEYYDIPPIEYNTSGKIINIITKELDSGWAGDFYLIGGQFFSMFTPYLSYINGKNKFTLGYDLHISHKRDVKDNYEDSYNYNLNGTNYNYLYKKEDQNWGNQQGISFSYSNVKNGNYIFQTKIGLGLTRNNNNESKDIALSIANFTDKQTGLLTNRVKSVAPSIDIYYSKKIGKNSEIKANLYSVLFKNDQKVYSEEKGLNGFEDRMALESEKKTIIAELNYSTKIGSHRLSAGYRSHFSLVDNKLSNSFTSSDDADIYLRDNYFFGETSGRISGLTYRMSIGAKFINNSTESSDYNKFLFTPIMVLGYKINNDNYIRFTYRPYTKNPDIQQLSDNMILIMNNFLQTGNADLKNSFTHDLKLNYNYSKNILDVDVNIFYENVNNYIFDNFSQNTINNNQYIVISSNNAAMYYNYGVAANISLRPLKNISLGCNFMSYKQIFQALDESEKISKWFYPVTLYASYQYKNFSLDYYQKLSSKYLEGMYIMGTEKVSYLSAGYSIKDWSFQLNYYFPFAKNIFSNYTLGNSIVENNTAVRLKSKEKTIGISVSWNFSTSREQYKLSRSIYNEDIDNGFFNVK
ncbi:MAG: TonB-dependent receptor [Prevotellaceae bacterium]|jgi:hypothetical protein|nr:TonB-dependent receptor [Prevotellaceae bacterium]